MPSPEISVEWAGVIWKTPCVADASSPSWAPALLGDLGRAQPRIRGGRAEHLDLEIVEARVVEARRERGELDAFSDQPGHLLRDRLDAGDVLRRERERLTQLVELDLVGE